MEQAGARIGPNAIIQVGETLSARHAGDLAQRIYARAGLLAWLHTPPSDMVEEQAVARLFDAVVAEAGDAPARDILREAGRRTGHYILTHRIPAVARAVLPRLPAALALRILLRAIRKHAWTFAGSGTFSYCLTGPPHMTISGNPLIPAVGCVWHAAVFETVFAALIGKPLQVREDSRRDGTQLSRFAITS